MTDDKKRYTRAYVEYRLDEAANVERFLTDKEVGFFVSKSNWPEYFQDWYTGCMDLSGRTKIKITPTSQQVTRYEEVVNWVAWLATSRDQNTIKLAKVVWARSQGASWRKIAARIKKSHVTCEKWYGIAISQLVKMLNESVD